MNSIKMKKIIVVLAALLVFESGCSDSNSEQEASAVDFNKSNMNGVFVIAESPEIHDSHYKITILGRQDYSNCDKHCPIVYTYISVIGEGDPPQLIDSYIGSGFDWRLDEWANLPDIPLFDTNKAAVAIMSFIPRESPNGQRRSLSLEIYWREIVIN